MTKELTGSLPSPYFAFLGRILGVGFYIFFRRYHGKILKSKSVSAVCFSIHLVDEKKKIMLIKNLINKIQVFLLVAEGKSYNKFLLGLFMYFSDIVDFFLKSQKLKHNSKFVNNSNK